jgi:hypothetical protein
MHDCDQQDQLGHVGCAMNVLRNHFLPLLQRCHLVSLLSPHLGSSVDVCPCITQQLHDLDVPTLSCNVKGDAAALQQRSQSTRVLMISQRQLEGWHHNLKFV